MDSNTFTVIPAIDIIAAKCVRLTQGDYDKCNVYDCSPEEMALRFVEHGLSYIHAVDLDGAKARKPCNLSVLSAISKVPNAQIEWSGGISSDESLKDCIEHGATTCVIGSVAVKHPEFMEEWLKTFGPQQIILGADLNNGKAAITGWQNVTSVTAEDLIDRFIPFGLDKAIITDISKDGMLSGPSFSLYESLRNAYPNVTFTISGGVSSIDDIRRLVDMGFTRAIVGKAIYEGRIKLNELESYLNNYAG